MTTIAIGTASSASDMGLLIVSETAVSGNNIPTLGRFFLLLSTALLPLAMAAAVGMCL